MVLNKFLLFYVGSKSIFRKIASQNSASQKWLVSFPWINKKFIHSQTKGGPRIADKSVHRDIAIIKYVKTIYTIMKTCSEQPNYIRNVELFSCLEAFSQSYSFWQKIVFGYLKSKPKNSIKIQNPKIQVLVQKFFEKWYMLKKWPNA